MENRIKIIAIPPGESIKEQLDQRHMNQVEFAERMGCSTKFISQLINGKVPLTHQTALKLESVLSIPARFWNTLETLYQEDLAKIEQEKELQSEISIAKKFPYNDMVKLGWLPARSKPHEKVEELRRFFEVASLSHVNHIRKLSAIFRRLDHGIASDFSQSAWLQKSYLDARNIQTLNFSKIRLNSMIPILRMLTIEHPLNFVPQLVQRLSDCGVALVVLPDLQNTFIHGATTWESKTKAIITLSLQGRYIDQFWFSLFHEIGHLLLHEKDQAFIQYDDYTAEDLRESEADDFALEALIPTSTFNEFLHQQCFSETAVLRFARSISIHPGILVSRLQHQQLIGTNHLNHLNVKYD